MRQHSTSHPWAMFSTMERCLTSISLSAVGYTRRPNGSTSMKMAWSQAISAPRALTSSHTLLTSTSLPTTVSTHPSRHYLHGSTTCSPDPEVTSTSFRAQWPRLMIGAWRGRSCATNRSTTILPISQSRLRSTSRTLKQHKLTLHHVSPALCLPALQNTSKHFAIH
jgi:hypothetical protein